MISNSPVSRRPYSYQQHCKKLKHT